MSLPIPGYYSSNFQSQAAQITKATSGAVGEAEVLHILEQEWRNGVSSGLNDSDAYEKAVQSVGSPASVQRDFRDGLFFSILASPRKTYFRLCLFFALTCWEIFSFPKDFLPISPAVVFAINITIPLLILGHNKHPKRFSSELYRISFTSMLLILILGTGIFQGAGIQELLTEIWRAGLLSGALFVEILGYCLFAVWGLLKILIWMGLSTDIVGFPYRAWFYGFKLKLDFEPRYSSSL